MQDVKKAYAWQESLELSKRLVSICEEFSDPDTNVLVWHLRQAVVDIPAGIAADLQASRGATMDAVLKLVTELELVKRIYPAIDTSATEEQLEKLMERMQSQNFAEREPEPEDESSDTDQGELEVGPQEEAEVEAEPQPAGGTVVAPKVDGVTTPTIVSIDPES